MMLALTIPATLGLMVLARPIVALLFERGRFTPCRHGRHGGCSRLLRDRTGRLLDREGGHAHLLRASAESRTPVVVSAVIVVVNALLNVLMVRRFGYTGLAFGTSISALANAVLLLYLLRDAWDRSTAAVF